MRRLVGEKGAPYVMQALRWRDTRRNVAVGLVMSTVGFVLARLHLWFFDWWYLRKGAAEKFEDDLGHRLASRESSSTFIR